MSVVKVIKRGRSYREGYGITQQWYYWDCEICETKNWYLNQDAMMRASEAHKDSHNDDKA